MNKNGLVKMSVYMEVTVPQALALQAMFDYWNELSGMGASRFVGFYCDGDGNFHPHAHCMFNEELPELTDELRAAAVQKDDEGDRMYDFDGIAWKLDSQLNDMDIIREALDLFKNQDMDEKRYIASWIIDEIERRGLK